MLLPVLASIVLASEPVEIDIGTKPVAPEDLPPAAPPSATPLVTKEPDCLAGVCLGAKPSSTVDSLATVANHKWTRSIETCGGQIVGIMLWAGWYQTGFEWKGARTGSTTPVYGGDGTAARMIRDRVVEAMESKGWVFVNFKDTVSVYANPKVSSARGVSFERSGDTLNGWSVSVAAVHPDRTTLCASKYAQGL